MHDQWEVLSIREEYPYGMCIVVIVYPLFQMKSTDTSLTPLLSMEDNVKDMCCG